MKSAHIYNRSNVYNVIVHGVDEVHYGMLIVDLVLFKCVLWRFANTIDRSYIFILRFCCLRQMKPWEEFLVMLR